MSRKHNSSYRRLTAAALLTALTMNATACGSDSSGSDDGDSLTVVASGAYIPYAPLYIAQQKGYFEDQKLDVNIQLIAESSTAMSALLTDSAQVALAATVHAWRSDISGRPVTMIGANDGQNSVSLVLSTSAYEETGITSSMSVEDKLKRLGGVKFGVRSLTSLDGATLQTMLASVGLTPDDVGIVSLTSPPALVSALSSGQIDGFVGGAPFPQQVIADDKGQIVVDLTAGEFPPLDGVTTIAYLAAPDYIKEDPEKLQAFMNGIAAAQRFIDLHPEEAANTLSEVKDFKAYPLDLLATQMSEMAKSDAILPTPVVSEDALEKGRPLLDAALEEKSTLDFGTTFTNEFATRATDYAESEVK